MPERFSLSKWYLDVVAANGDAWIGYWALLNWKGLSLRYASALSSSGSGAPARSVTTLRPSQSPVRTTNQVTWSCGPLGIEGTWTAIDAPIQDTLFAAADGSAVWHCWQPRSRARVKTAGGELSGLGYVEELTLTLPPWRLPLDELRWGRFLAESGSVVWIDWRGPEPLRRVYVNGAPAAAARVGDDGLGLDSGGELVLERPRLVRSGALSSTALSILPRGSDIFPLRWLTAKETKWVSSGLLTGPTTPPLRGWAVHELVTLG